MSSIYIPMRSTETAANFNDNNWLVGLPTVAYSHRLNKPQKAMDRCQMVLFWTICALGILNILSLSVIGRTCAEDNRMAVRARGEKDVLIIIMNCGMQETNGLDLSRLPAPAYELECNNETNWIDCHESVPYLNFIIDHYDKPAAKRYVFMHGHEEAWHLSGGNSYFALYLLFGLEYFWSAPYGGFCGVQGRSMGIG